MSKFMPLLGLALGAFSLLGNTALASSLASVGKGDVIPVQLHQLVPTQASVGFDQVFYKLGRFADDTEKKFDEVCESNGQKAIKSFNRRSQVAVSDSFECTDAIGTDKGAMKTVVIGPDEVLYLTDGHHTFNVFWHMEGGGANFPIHVVVQEDYRDMAEDEFWTRMERENNLWLYDSRFQKITYDQLPASLGLEHFHNNLYRALMYFTRDIAWSKPRPEINFVEFHWGKELYDKIDLTTYDLNSRRGYRKAVQDMAELILASESRDVGGFGRTVRQMGQFQGFDKDEFEKLFRANRKIDYTLRYKKQTSAKGLGYDKAVNSSNSTRAIDAMTIAGAVDFMSIPPLTVTGDVNAIIEIPAGTSAKWELDQDDTRHIIWEVKNDQPRIVNYMGYPGNYGTIPGTALPKELGGDGDPLDVLVLGQTLPRGEVVSVRLLSVLKMLDAGEQDDKLLGVLVEDSPFADVMSMQELDASYPGVSDIVRIWFQSYKGPGADMVVQEYGDAAQAMAVLDQAIAAYQPAR